MRDSKISKTAFASRKRRPSSGTGLLALLLTVALLAAACGSDDADDASSSTTTETADTTGETASESSTTTEPDVVDSTTTTEAEESTTTTTEDDGVPGEPLDFGPQLGTPLAVVGVEYDDALNFRTEPSPSAAIVTSSPPLADDLDMSALGEAWNAPGGVWWKVNIVGQEAWANQKFLGTLGASVDFFDVVAEELGVLMFPDVESAALAVAETQATTEPESRIVFVGEPLAFNGVGGFATVDVLDVGDDALKGLRLAIETELVYDEESGDEGAQDVAFVVLTGVEMTPICGRGVSDGLCV